MKYVDILYCETCKEDTYHVCYDQEHERDTSNNYAECQGCLKKNQNIIKIDNLHNNEGVNSITNQTEEQIMKTSKSNFDYAVYIILCIVSGGLFWLLRVLISEGVRQAFDDKKE